MNRPRITARRLMIALALVAVSFIFYATIERRRRQFLHLASAHHQQVLNLARPGGMRSVVHLTERQQVMIYWHQDLALKYYSAARRPWLPVEPDVPEPE